MDSSPPAHSVWIISRLITILMSTPRQEKVAIKLAVRVIGLLCNTLGMELGTRKYKH